MHSALTGPTDHGTAIVTLRGELDLAASRDLYETLHQLVASSPGGIVLDLAGLTFCDSSGLSTFIHIDQELRAADHQRLHLTRPTAQMMEVLAITALDRALHID